IAYQNLKGKIGLLHENALETIADIISMLIGLHPYRNKRVLGCFIGKLSNRLMLIVVFKGLKLHFGLGQYLSKIFCKIFAHFYFFIFLMNLWILSCLKRR